MDNLLETNQCCTDHQAPCFELEAVVSFDDRGQLVLPKELRKKFNLNAGEKFALISCTDKEGLCCLSLIKTKALNTQIAKTIGPLLGGLGRII